MDRKEERRERNNETSIDRKRNRRIYRGSKRICGLLSPRVENPRHRSTPIRMSDDAISRNNTEYRSVIRGDYSSSLGILFETNRLSSQHPNGKTAKGERRFGEEGLQIFTFRAKREWEQVISAGHAFRRASRRGNGEK